MAALYIYKNNRALSHESNGETDDQDRIESQDANRWSRVSNMRRSYGRLGIKIKTNRLKRSVLTGWKNIWVIKCYRWSLIQAAGSRGENRFGCSGTGWCRSSSGCSRSDCSSCGGGRSALDSHSSRRLFHPESAKVLDVSRPMVHNGTRKQYTKMKHQKVDKMAQVLYVLENDKALIVLGRWPGKNNAAFQIVTCVCRSVLIKNYTRHVLIRA